MNALETDMAPGCDLKHLTLLVTHKAKIADGIVMFELRAPTGRELPAFSPGAHITVTTPSGRRRRYSLCNDCEERDRYVIAVKREEASRGGSLSMTDELMPGHTIEIDPPANQFAMSSVEPKRIIFIAGGIGITPIRAMTLYCLRRGKPTFMLYYFTRSSAVTAFRDELAASAFADKVVLHHDQGDPGQAFDLWPVLEQQDGAHLYCCGPRGLMDAVRDMTGHWPDSAVHFEDFVGAVENRADDKAFEVRLARAGTSYEVAAGVSILDTLRDHGHVLASSCESGTCGTCRTRFVDGQPDHRDLVLSEAERKSEIMICVSRARSRSLTLDI